METTCSGSFAVAQAGLPGIVTRARERRTVLCVALPVKAGRPNVKAGRPNAPHGGLPGLLVLPSQNGACFFSGRPNVKAGRPNVKAGRPNAPHGRLPGFVLLSQNGACFFW